MTPATATVRARSATWPTKWSAGSRTACRLARIFRAHFGEPLDLDLWIGLPEEHHARVAQMLAPKLGASSPEDEFAAAMADPSSLTRRAFASPAE